MLLLLLLLLFAFTGAVVVVVVIVATEVVESVGPSRRNTGRSLFSLLVDACGGALIDDKCKRNSGRGWDECLITFLLLLRTEVNASTV